MGFSSLGLSDWIVNQLKTIGISQPSPVQRDVIPRVLQGRDCVACSKTGSGKTLAFALPIIQKLSQDPYGVFALVLTPTRELALQVFDQFCVLGRSIGLQCEVCIGGRDMIEQASRLQNKPHVVVATPGRLVDHLSVGNCLSLNRLKFMVLDEADRLIAGRFDEDLAQIFHNVPPDRQTLLFSATCNEFLQKLNSLSKNNCHYYEDIGSEATVTKLRQSYVMCAESVKDATLVDIVNDFVESGPGQLMVFVNKCREGTVLAMTLNRLGIAALALHSQMKQVERTAALTKFKSGTVRVLFTTDVGSRGLDIPLVDMVINYSLPSVAREYIHRVGRTARAGRGGAAISLVSPVDVNLLKLIEQRAGVEFSETKVDDKRIVNILTEVRVTRRAQELKAKDSEMVERRRINKMKDLILQGLDPDQVRHMVKSTSSKRKRKH